jgi:hypothetical protein
MPNISPGREDSFLACVPGSRFSFENTGRVYITPWRCDIGCGEGNHRITQWNKGFPRGLQRRARRRPEPNFLNASILDQVFGGAGFDL